MVRLWPLQIVPVRAFEWVHLCVWVLKTVWRDLTQQLNSTLISFVINKMHDGSY